MISVVITRHNNEIQGVSLTGHAEYSDPGHDIVCAAVSALVINTFNSIEKFTDDAYVTEATEDGGYMTMEFPEGISEREKLLLDSLLLGLDEIQKQYGDEYISLQYKEV